MSFKLSVIRESNQRNLPLAHRCARAMTLSINVLFCLALLCSAYATAKSPKPNILLIVLDDVGMTDLGSFGGEIATPNLDRLAKNGTRFNQFYTAPTCSPTRAMLLTGTDNHPVGLGNMHEELAPNQKGQPGYQGYLNTYTETLPEVLKHYGYQTFMSGKWHLGLEKEYSPAARGFDKSYALLQGGGGHFTDLGLFGQPSVYRENGEVVKLPEDFYSTRFFTEKMLTYLRQNEDTNAPFFAYIAYSAVHWPLQAPAASIKKYEGRYQQGYQKLADSRLTNAIEKGVFPSNSQLPPLMDGEPQWQQLSAQEKRIEQRKMEIYAAMLDDVDVNIGRILEYLKQTGQFEDTLIFVMSDNGAEGHDLQHGLADVKPWIAACCDNSYQNMGRENSYLLLGPNWARASVGASRAYKGATTEGGIRAPAILKLPRLLPDSYDPLDTLDDRFFTVKDIMPTLLDMINQGEDFSNVYPKRLLMTGNNFLQSATQQVEMGWELMGRKAYRYGTWKIVEARPPYGIGKWQLFNLASDPLEQDDLAGKRPEIYQQLVAKWNRYAQHNGIILPDWVSGY